MKDRKRIAAIVQLTRLRHAEQRVCHLGNINAPPARGRHFCIRKDVSIPDTPTLRKIRTSSL
jgi:hypothetical protein